MKKKIAGRFVFLLSVIILSCFFAVIIKNNSKNSSLKSYSQPEVQEASNDSKITLNIPFIFFTEIPKDFEKVNQAFNRLVETELGFSANLTAILSSARTTTATMMKNEGIVFDLFPSTLGSPFTDEENLLKLDSLLQTDGSEILNIFSKEELSAEHVRANGHLIRLPNKSDIAECTCVVIRKDFLEKHNITQKASSLEELDQILGMIAQSEKDLFLIAPSRLNRSFLNRYYTWFPVGEGGLVIMNYGNTETIEILYETEEYKQMVSMFYQWKQKGWMPDLAFLNDFPSSDLVKNQELIGYFCHYKPGIDTQESMKCGYDMEAWILTEPILISNQTRCSWAISKQSNYPKEAMQLLNFMYSSKEAMNLLNYGIEGKNYQISESGNAVPIPYQEESLYYSSLGWELPNQYLCTPWGGDPSDIWEKTQTFNESAQIPDSIEFAFLGSGYESELSAMENIIEEYAFGLETGNLDPEKYLPEFLEKLQKAGSEKVKNAANEQYQNWRKSQ